MNYHYHEAPSPSSTPNAFTPQRTTLARDTPSPTPSLVPDKHDDWVTSSLIGTRMDLVPARKPSDLQIILRTRDHAAFYDPVSNELSLQRRSPAAESFSPIDGTQSVARDLRLQSALAVGREDGRFRNNSARGRNRNAGDLFGNATSDVAAPDRPLVPLRRGNNGHGQELTASACPTCLRPWPLPTVSPNLNPPHASPFAQHTDVEASVYEPDAPTFVAHNYFRLLAQASSVPGSINNTRPSTPTFARGSRFESASGSSTPDLGSVGGGSRSYRGRTGESSRSRGSSPEPIDHAAEAEGYYSRFFVELKRLGRGARGQVFLCQHVLNGNKLGKYAIKKIPVGDHAQSLLQSLNEVHLMESLHHPHLIHYQHAWIERCQLSHFAPSVPTLFVLMMAANGGSLADWISARAGDANNDSPRPSGNSSSADSPLRKATVATALEPTLGSSADIAPSSPVKSASERRRIERLKTALRQRRANRQAASPLSTEANTISAMNDDQDGKTVDIGTSGTAAQMSTAPRPSLGNANGTFGMGGVGVHLLREEEIYSLLHDMTSGLGFLHDRGILHLDIKPGNVLLHWDEDAMIPRAMLSDFGSSLLVQDNWARTRSGHTGTIEYMSPETVLVDPVTGQLKELSSKADIWSLGMILHLLLFFSLPFQQTDDIVQLRAEMQTYTGFSAATSPAALRARRTDPTLLRLLERMLTLDPQARPSCADILHVLNARLAAKTPPSAGHSATTRPKARQARSHSTGDRGEQYHEADDGRTSLALYRPDLTTDEAGMQLRRPLAVAAGDSGGVSGISTPSADHVRAMRPGQAGPAAPLVHLLTRLGVPMSQPTLRRLHIATNTTIAFVKILSPRLVLSRANGPHLAPAQPRLLEPLVTLLALVDLAISLSAAQPSEAAWFSDPSAICTAAHLAILALLYSSDARR
ncbi:kinase-like protein [Testicularia cyperi]|uniref:non-specific serine/threonine protein kinase n=1 Tax=Testicularia cyperi TaxID=1882483 RepID=A0A317XN85_9BASI|nr:kinase-like protein [Testicularia cyperi]